MNTELVHDALVIGAGLSGLNAARHLETQGLSVQVIEGRDRIGGRAYSIQVPGGPAIDLGGQWISDAHERALKLAEEAGITYHPTYSDGEALHIHHGRANRVPYDYLPVGLLGKLDLAMSFRRLDRLSQKIDRLPVEEFDRQALSALIEKLSWSKCTRDLAGHILARDLCVPTGEISVYELIEQLASMGGTRNAFSAEQYIITRGARQFADFLAEQLKSPVILGETVSAVHQTDDFVIVRGTLRSYKARRVIIAIPPQLLPGIFFKPSLPQQRRSVLEAFVDARVIKTIAVFEAPWWRSKGLSGSITAPGEPFPVVADSSPRETQFGILTALTTAEDTAPLKKLSEAERCQAFVDWLEDIAGEPIPQPIRTYSMDWTEEPLSRGGYASRRGIGGWTAANDLFAPFGRVHFAGTETSDVWRSYLEGALAAGERAASEIHGLPFGG